MKTVDAIKAAGSAKQIAEILDISQSAVSQWGDYVPELREYQLRERRPDVQWSNATSAEAA
jgi:DNA-binding transcriptional regulator YdaS (Cro superfamily)